MAGLRGRRVADALVVAAATAAVMVWLAHDGGKSSPTTAVTGASAADGLASNQLTLSAVESRRLLRWATAFRDCLERSGVGVGAPVATRTQIAMRPRGSPKTANLLATTTRCGERLGDPPRDASLQLVRDGRIVLYLPKQCLLDPTVAEEAAG